MTLSNRFRVNCNQVKCKHHGSHTGDGFFCVHWQEEIEIGAQKDPYENWCGSFELHEDFEEEDDG